VTDRRARSWWRWHIILAGRHSWGAEIGIYHGCHRRTYLAINWRQRKIVVSLNQRIDWPPAYHLPTCRLHGPEDPFNTTATEAA